MILTQNDKWRISVDTHGNHCPELYTVKPGGVKLPRGGVSQPSEGWEHQGKYFGSVGLAVRYIATQDASDDVLTVAEYVDKVEANVDRMVKELGR
jgi:hypothetical protein